MYKAAGYIWKSATAISLCITFLFFFLGLCMFSCLGLICLLGPHEEHCIYFFCSVSLGLPWYTNLFYLYLRHCITFSSFSFDVDFFCVLVAPEFLWSQLIPHLNSTLELLVVLLSLLLEYNIHSLRIGARFDLPTTIFIVLNVITLYIVVTFKITYFFKAFFSQFNHSEIRMHLTINGMFNWELFFLPW